MYSGGRGGGAGGSREGGEIEPEPFSCCSWEAKGGC